MATGRGLGACVWFTLLLLLVGSAAWGDTISGSVSSNTEGRIYLRLLQEPGGTPTDLGTSIDAAGAFNIWGADPGTQYSVEAYLDTQGTGIQHANDPVGRSGAVSATTGPVSVGSFSLQSPAYVPPQAPEVIVYRGSGGNFVLWGGARGENSLPIAEKYTISWSSSPTGPATSDNSKEVWSGVRDFFVHSGGSASLYYRVTAWVGSDSASSGWTPVQENTGTGRVTGRVYFPGVTPTGPLMVALAEESESPPRFHVLVVPNPVSGASYTASNVPPGTYTVYPILDLNNSGTFDYGDLGPADATDWNATVTVADSATSLPDITLADQNAATALTTNHGKSGENEWYHLQLSVQSMKKQVVRVHVRSGAQIGMPSDLALRENKFQLSKRVARRPSTTESCTVVLSYLDGSSDTMSKGSPGCWMPSRPRSLRWATSRTREPRLSAGAPRQLLRPILSTAYG